MSGSVNKVTLLGNLGQDPDIRHTQNGNMVVNLSVATSESWKDSQSGERRERTEWHRVVIFNENIGRIAEQYLRKGSKVYLEGQLQTRKWTDKDGADRYSTEVVLQNYRGTLVLLGDNGGKQQRQDRKDDDFTPADYQRAKSGADVPADPLDDDEIPF